MRIFSAIHQPEAIREGLDHPWPALRIAADCLCSATRPCRRQRQPFVIRETKSAVSIEVWAHFLSPRLFLSIIRPVVIRRRLDAVGLEDVSDRRVRDAVPEIYQRPLNPVIVARRTLLGDPKRQFDDLRRDRGTSRGFPAIAVVPVPSNQLAMSPEDRIRSHDGGQLFEHLSPENLASDSQSPPLVVGEQDSVLPERLSEDPILREEILEGVPLSAIDPASEDQEQQLRWLKPSLHVLPDAR